LVVGFWSGKFRNLKHHEIEKAFNESCSALRGKLHKNQHIAGGLAGGFILAIIYAVKKN
jgi:hypothetical protein